MVIADNFALTAPDWEPTTDLLEEGGEELKKGLGPETVAYAEKLREEGRIMRQERREKKFQQLVKLQKPINASETNDTLFIRGRNEYVRQQKLVKMGLRSKIDLEETAHIWHQNKTDAEIYAYARDKYNKSLPAPK
mmetsp:Transcript_67808/g.124797  ORF Transcript_67808/g.124797 Transcript_67808/m.124797 type:complete len:136 (+) Transcript_67808:132-539(+)